MKCPNCSLILKRVEVKVHGAENKAISFQCPNCDYFEFEPISSEKVISELRETPLKIKQKIIKISQDRLGIYFNKNIIESLNLKNGEEVYVSVPEKNRIILDLKK